MHALFALWLSERTVNSDSVWHVLECLMAKWEKISLKSVWDWRYDGGKLQAGESIYGKPLLQHVLSETANTHINYVTQFSIGLAPSLNNVW